MPMPTRQSRRAFSLLEVVLAIALVGGSLAVVLGLLPALARRAADSHDTHTAAHLADTVRSELGGQAAAGLDGLVAALPILTAEAEAGLQFVAARDGSDLRRPSASEAPGRERYFLVVVRRFDAPPLAYDAAAGFLAVNVTVAWPYQVPGAGGLALTTAASARQSLTFNIGLSR